MKSCKESHFLRCLEKYFLTPEQKQRKIAFTNDYLNYSNEIWHNVFSDKKIHFDYVITKDFMFIGLKVQDLNKDIHFKQSKVGDFQLTYGYGSLIKDLAFVFK